ncbi:MAG: hypothetical protein WEE36_09215 [Acidimicrobiia bacterium]
MDARVAALLDVLGWLLSNHLPDLERRLANALGSLEQADAEIEMLRRELENLRSIQLETNPKRRTRLSGAVAAVLAGTITAAATLGSAAVVTDATRDAAAVTAEAQYRSSSIGAQAQIAASSDLADRIDEALTLLTEIMTECQIRP